MRQTIALVVFAVLLLCFVGCASNGASADGLPDRDDLAGTWTLVTIDGEPAAGLVEGDAPMLNVAPTDTPGGKRPITGFAGVNRYFGELDGPLLDDGVWSVGALGMTRMMGPADAMRLEQRFGAAISGPARVSLREGVLTIVPDEGTELVFGR